MNNLEWLTHNDQQKLLKMLTGHSIDCPMKNEKCGSPYQDKCCGEISAEDVIECQRAFGNWLQADREN